MGSERVRQNWVTKHSTAQAQQTREIGVAQTSWLWGADRHPRENLVFNPFSMYLLSSYHAAGPVLESGDTAVNKIDIRHAAVNTCWESPAEARARRKAWEVRELQGSPGFGGVQKGGWATVLCDGVGGHNRAPQIWWEGGQLVTLRQQSPRLGQGPQRQPQEQGTCKKSAGQTERKRMGFLCTLSSLVL